MNGDKVIAAQKEARRFLEAVEAWRKNRPEYDFVGNKESGAVRRASMDLTRALADMRRPN